MQEAALGVVLATSTFAGTLDLLFRRVPNQVLMLGLACVAMLFLLAPSQTMGGAMVASWGCALAGFALGMGVFFPLWRLGAMGAGDVKFLAVLGFCLGPYGLFASWLVGSVLAGGHVLVSTLGGRWLGEVHAIWWRLTSTRPGCAVHERLQVAWKWMLARRGNRRGTPYVTYLAIGAITWVLVLSRQ